MKKNIDKYQTIQRGGNMYKILFFSILILSGTKTLAFFGGPGCHTGISEVSEQDVANANVHQQKLLRKTVDLQNNAAEVLKNELFCYPDYDYDACGLNLIRYDYRAVLRCTSTVYVDTERIKIGSTSVKQNKALEIANQVLGKLGFQKFAKISGNEYFFKSVNGISVEDVALFHKARGKYEVYENSSVTVYKDPKLLKDGDKIFTDEGTNLTELNELYEKAVNSKNQWYFNGRVGVLLKK